MRIKTEQSAETEYFTNDFHDALMKNLEESFGMFGNQNLKLPIVAMFLSTGISDGRVISDAFAKHFKEVCAPHSEHRNTELKAVYTETRSSYVSLMDFVEHESGSVFDVQCSY